MCIWKFISIVKQRERDVSAWPPAETKDYRHIHLSRKNYSSIRLVQLSKTHVRRGDAIDFLMFYIGLVKFEKLPFLCDKKNCCVRDTDTCVNEKRQRGKRQSEAVKRLKWKGTMRCRWQQLPLASKNFQRFEPIEPPREPLLNFQGLCFELDPEIVIHSLLPPAFLKKASIWQNFSRSAVSRKFSANQVHYGLLFLG